MRIAELIPKTAPFRSIRGPPELPGLMAASVWIAGNTVAGSFADAPRVVTGRLSALTIPVVTVLSRPKGDPSAMTCSPTDTSSELPSAAG
ncbi:MAG: hypothetical protein WKF82_02965 [Nocardioidaceae bacterium]